MKKLVGKVIRVNDGVGNERERPGSDPLLNERRVDVDNPIAESRLRARAAIM